jgi:hypothetical protein
MIIFIALALRYLHLQLRVVLPKAVVRCVVLVERVAIVAGGFAQFIGFVKTPVKRERKLWR